MDRETWIVEQRDVTGAVRLTHCDSRAEAERLFSKLKAEAAEGCWVSYWRM